MKIGTRGQVTIPKTIRERFGLREHTEIDFQVVNGVIVLKKSGPQLNLKKWKGRYKDSFQKLGYTSVDKFIDDIRGK